MTHISKITLMLLATATMAGAQSREQETTSADEHESLSRRIGSAVENVIDQLEREFSGRRFESPSRKTAVRETASDSILDGETVWMAGDDTSMTYQGNTVIQRGDTIRTNVVVKAGDLTVYGVIEGDVLVVGGDVYLRDGSTIGGNVQVINGEVNKDDDAVVVGYIDRSSRKRGKAYREEPKNFRRSSTKLNASWVNETTNLDNFIFRYNRVEGLFLGMGSEKRYYWDEQRAYSLYGSVGYGFKSHNWRGNLGLSRQFALGDARMIELEIEGHSLTDSKDDWLIGVPENTAAAFLIHEDFRDYFRRDGLGANMGYVVQQDDVTGQVKVGYLVDKYFSMDNRTDWSLFGGDKTFRMNPRINDGKMSSIVASAGLSTVSSTIYGNEGWSMIATAEIAKKNYGGDFEFNRYVVDIRRYQPLSRYDNVNIRIRVGTAEGALPLQKTFDIGGLGTLPAYEFKTESGNRMILMNAEWIVNGDFLGDLSFWPGSFLGGINFIVLTDAALVRTAGLNDAWNEGFNGITFSQLRHDVGVGVATRSGSFRVAFVWRTDHSEPARLIFRIARPF